METAGKFKYALISLVLVIAISAVLASNYSTTVKSIYAFKSQNVTLSDGAVVVTPEPMIGSDTQVKLWGLAPIGLWVGYGIGMFLLFFKFEGGKVRSRD